MRNQSPSLEDYLVLVMHQDKEPSSDVILSERSERRISLVGREITGHAEVTLSSDNETLRARTLV
jgi:hypothetical protein